MEIVVGVHLSLDQWKQVKIIAKTSGKQPKRVVEDIVHREIELVEETTQ